MTKQDKNHHFLPVVHVVNINQAKNQMEIAFNNNADGVFLIGGLRYPALFGVYYQLRKIYHDKWIGINCLDLNPLEMFIRLPEGVNGVWTDNAYIDERYDIDDQEYPKQVKELIDNLNWNGLYFGGVAFKYQRKVEDYAKATKIACKYMDVVTTSGAGTGLSANPRKVKIMGTIAKKYNKKLGLASGVSIENINKYKLVNYFLVKTRISQDYITFNPILVKKLADKIHKLN